MIKETVILCLIMTGYVVICALILALIRYKFNVKDYVFRKLMHTAAYTSVIVMLLFAKTWYCAVIADLLFLTGSLITLFVCKRFSFYNKLLVEKKKGEIAVSFTMTFLLVAALIAVFWGGLSAKYIVYCSILSWGPADACAALFGIKFGKHIIKLKHIDGKKTYEGSIAMLAVSFTAAFITLAVTTQINVFMCMLFALVVAVCACLTELFTTKGLDNITIPLVCALVLCLTLI